MQCEACSNEHDGSYGSGRFCTSACARGFSTRTKRAEINERVSVRLRKPIICKSCGKSFFRPRQKDWTKRRCPECVAVKPSLPRCSLRQLDECKTDRSRKKWLIAKHCHQCFWCKGKEWMGQPIPIEIDHISGNSDDNSEENLRLLCCNCHAQTPTYKSKNRASYQRRLLYKKYPRPPRGATGSAQAASTREAGGSNPSEETIIRACASRRRRVHAGQQQSGTC